MFDGILRIARHVQHLDAGRAAPDRDRPQSTIIFNNTEILIPHFPSIVDIQCGEKAILL